MIDTRIKDAIYGGRLTSHKRSCFVTNETGLHLLRITNDICAGLEKMLQEVDLSPYEF